MRFGGHETFVIREGWLHKGVKLLKENPEQLVHEDAADFLGVGRNMAKSIRHWLVATGLAQSGPGKGSMLRPTDFGNLVAKHDPYFIEPGTWWALHINLACCSTHAITWTWFFNSFNFDRFDRPVCLESLKRHLESLTHRMPGHRTLERDLACLLASYARIIPTSNEDPEESNDCPLRELGLLSYFKTSGYYQTHRGCKEVPAELFGYSLSKTFDDAAVGKGTTDITLLDASRLVGGPGRVLVLSNETLFEVATQAEDALGSGQIEIVGLAGNRAIRVVRRPAVTWLRRYYNRVKRKDRHAA